MSKLNNIKHIFLLLIVISMATLCKKDKTRENLTLDPRIVGYWDLTYDSRFDNYGYIFTDDGEFYHIAISHYHKKDGECGSTGKWDVQGNRIRVLIENDCRWKRKWKEDPNDSTKVIPVPNNSRKLYERDESKWLEIGDVRMYTPAKDAIDNGNTFTRPENIFLKWMDSISADKSDFGSPYWKVCDSKYRALSQYPQETCKLVESEIKFFEEMK